LVGQYCREVKLQVTHRREVKLQVTHRREVKLGGPVL